jgi:hypothetical protein
MIHCFKPGIVIKAAKVCVALLFCLATSRVVFAESSIQGNVVNAPATIEKSTNIAAGSDNKAVQSSVTLKNIKMSGTVANSVQSKSAVNAAVGKRNVAGQGSISLSQGTVEGTVLNSVTTKSTINMAAGSDNQANQSSVAVKTSTVKGTVGNISMGKNMLNAAVGSRNQANQSAIISNNSNISGTLSNSSIGESKVNMAIGTDNKADQGTIRIENSRIRGTVTNTSTMQKSTNMAVGTGNSASQAAIVMGGAQLHGTAVNTATGENAMNAAVGYRNEANQSSVVVDGDQAGSGSAVNMPQNSFHADSGITGQGGHGTLAYPARTRVEDAKERKAARHVPGQVVFLVDNDKAGLAGLDRIAQKYHLEVDEKTVLKSLNRIMVVASTAKDAAEIAEAMKKESGVFNPQPNYVFATMGQEDPLSHMQNLVSMLDLQELHGKVSGKNITVAVVDTGVEVEHQDLRSRIVGYQNFVSGSVYRGEIHGTAVAGIIAAGNNEYGIVGIAPDVSLLALRACRQVSKMSALGECFSTSLAGSLDAAISAKADVVNLSLGAYVDDTLLSMMIESGYKKGIVFAAPVGNDPAADNIAFPASHDKVISVAGLDESGNPLPSKRLASMADAVAPAAHLFVTTPGDSYNFSDGTSLASASISGIIALAMEKKTARNASCLPRFDSAVPWPEQVLACIGL